MPKPAANTPKLPTKPTIDTRAMRTNKPADRRRRRRFACTVTGALAFLVLLPTTAQAEFWSVYESEQSNTKAAQRIVDRMSEEELVGQVLMLGYPDSVPDDEFVEWIRNAGIGGIKIFGWNGRDLLAMSEGIATMQSAAYNSRLRVPLLVATDQEGGWVRHVKGQTSRTPGNLALGASGLALDAYRNGRLIGSELMILGINMNFAPTVDIYVHPEADIVGPRAFSDDPLQTGFLASAFYRGQEEAGVISTAKHFPGHGNTDKDSHGTLPIINDDMSTIWERDLLPYRMLVPEGLPAVMIGHLGYPEILGEGTPSTLSPVFVEQVLRDRIEFDGVIITDDMIMYGARRTGESVSEACETALRVGNDIVLVSGPPELQREIYDYLVSVAESDADFRTKLEEAARRVLTVKYRYFGTKNPGDLLPESSSLIEKLEKNYDQSAILDLACRSVTVIREPRVPLKDDSDSDDVLLLGQYTAFFREGKRRYPNAQTYLFSYLSLPENERRDIAALARDAETIVLCLANEISLDVLTSLESYADRITVFSVLTPVYLRYAPWVKSAIATYATTEESFRAGFAVLAGDFQPEGRLPVPGLLGN